MQRNNRFFLGKAILTVFLSCLLLAKAQAAGPLWSILPAPGSHPSQTVPAGGSALIQYIVQNQSHKPKRLIIQPIQGIQQTTSCLLAPKGQAGSSCILNLAVSGSALPEQGIHGGPALCQANADGSPNPGQCYQPSAAHVLHITRGSVLLEVTDPVAIQILDADGVSTISITVENIGSTSANNVQVSAPWTGVVFNPGSNCGTIAPGDSCTFTISTSTPNIAGQVSIQGDNTNTVTTPFIAFRAGGGLVFSVDNGITKVVTEDDIALSVAWDPNCPACVTIADGTDKDNGELNTQNIVSSIGAGTYAAQVCNSHGDGTFTDWYLPAICEIGGTGNAPPGGCGIANIYHNLYVHGFEALINNSSEFSTFYWSSTGYEPDSDLAWALAFDPGSAVGQFGNGPKLGQGRIRCVRAF